MSKMSKKHYEILRKKFEEFALRFINQDPAFVLRNEVDGYVDEQCSKAWNLFHNAASTSRKERIFFHKHSIERGMLGNHTRCIIGSLDDTGRIRCSTSPRIHLNGAQADNEASRLAEVHPGKTFYIFALVPEKYKVISKRTVNISNANAVPVITNIDKIFDTPGEDDGNEEDTV